MATAHDDIHEAEGTLKAFLNSFLMIIFSEIGDKTFLIAAILAMRHPRLAVFAGAFGSLVVMSSLSAAMGHILPTLIPKQWTQVAAAVLFFIFGTKMMAEGRGMKGGNQKMQEEMREAQEEIEGDDAEHDGTGATTANGDVISLEQIEEGGRKHADATTLRSPGGVSSHVRGWGDGARNFCSLFLGPVFVQSFVLTFLGEWGDRSQIATIALGAAHVRPSHILSCVHSLILLNRMCMLLH
jgi:putative Ca2+/H+ antiporter (TMEM165/GDT1 family)